MLVCDHGAFDIGIRSLHAIDANISQLSQGSLPEAL
jgi:hypothetical protein